MSEEGDHTGGDPMETGVSVSMVTPVPMTGVPANITAMSESHSGAGDVINNSLKGNVLAMDGTGDCGIKLLESGNLMIAAGNPSAEPGQHATMLAQTSLVDSEVGQLNIADSQPGMSSPFQPGVIYVGQPEGQLSEQGLLLAADSHGTALNLDHADLIPTAVPVSEEVSQELVAAQEGADQLAVLQAASDSADASSKYVDLAALQSVDGSLVFNPNQLQNLVLKTPSGETIQVVAVQNLFSDLTKGKLIQIGPTDEAGNVSAQLMQASGSQQLAFTKPEKDGSSVGIGQQLQMGQSMAGILVAGSSNSSKPLPPGTPVWATRINDCEKIGDSYRGWVETEMDLDLLLTFHKQQTHSFWGTRQSPSPAKPSTRLMWKSQYVPFDGIPFVNAGSRAIVLECQFGPRRKGAQSKGKTEDPKGVFKQTCPARIYIKKVKKFPDFAVDVNLDKKMLKLNMDKAFMSIREMNLTSQGQERYYVQLPTEEAHEFHGEAITESPHRLDPRVADKIRDLVANGQTRLYDIRKALRRFVEKELFASEPVPEKHNLTFYPTVNDLQNHIHQAIGDMESGVLPVSAPMVKVEMVSGNSSDAPGSAENFPLWQLPPTEGQPHTESVTVTLTQNPGEDGQHVISKVETHLSDGSTQVTTNLTPETARLLSKLHPNMFPGEAAPIQEFKTEPLPDHLPTTTLESIQPATGHMTTDTMDAMPNAQGQFVVMEGVSDSDAALILGDGSPIVEIDQEMQISEDAEHDQHLKLMPSKLVGDEDLARYDPSCVPLRPDDMSTVVDVSLDGSMNESMESTMESANLDKSLESESDIVHVLTIAVNQ